MIGRFAANFLAEIVHTGQRMTLGCGRTLRAMVDALPKPAASGIAVVQAMGNLGHEAHKIDYNEIARRAAEVLGGQAYYVSAPAILGIKSGSAEDFVAANASLYYSLGLAKKSDIYVVGLGSMEIDHTYVRVGLIQEDEWDELKALGAVGDICGRFFDARGRELHSPFHDRIVGIVLDDLRHAVWSIVVAGGEDKVAPLLGAIRGGFVNVVVSDEATIDRLLEMDESTR
jgi:DNA-binding transcriptional regulator LsrR (DeoR family)